MFAKKKNKVVTSKRIILPSTDELKRLAQQFNVAETTIQNYLNVSNNRTSPKAIDVQMAAINFFGGKLVEQQAFDYSLIVYDDDNTIIYQLD